MRYESRMMKSYSNSSPTPNVLLVLMFMSSTPLPDIIEGLAEFHFHVDPVSLQKIPCQMEHRWDHPRIPLNPVMQPHFFPPAPMTPHSPPVLGLSPVSFIGHLPLIPPSQAASMSSTKLSPMPAPSFPYNPRHGAYPSVIPPATIPMNKKASSSANTGYQSVSHAVRSQPASSSLLKHRQNSNQNVRSYDRSSPEASLPYASKGTTTSFKSSSITNRNNDNDLYENSDGEEDPQEKMSGMMSQPEGPSPSRGLLHPPSLQDSSSASASKKFSSPLPEQENQQTSRKDLEEEPQGKRSFSSFQSSRAVEERIPPATSSVVARMSRQASPYLHRSHHHPSHFTSYHHSSPEGVSTSFPNNNFEPQQQYSYLSSPPSPTSANFLVVRNTPNYYQSSTNNMMTMGMQPGYQAMAMVPVPVVTPSQTPTMTTMTAPMSMMEKTCNCMCEDKVPTQAPNVPPQMQVKYVPMMMGGQQPPPMMPMMNPTPTPSCNNNPMMMMNGGHGNNKQPMMNMMPPSPPPMMQPHMNNNQYRPQQSPSPPAMMTPQQQSADSNSYYTNEGLDSYNSFSGNNNNNFYGNNNVGSQGMSSGHHRHSSKGSSNQGSHSGRKNHLNSHNHHDPSSEEYDSESEGETSFPEGRTRKKMTTSSNSHHPSSRHNHYKKNSDAKKTRGDRSRFNQSPASYEGESPSSSLEATAGGSDVQHKNNHHHNLGEDPEEVNIPSRTSSKSPEVTGHYSLVSSGPAGGDLLVNTRIPGLHEGSEWSDRLLDRDPEAGVSLGGVPSDLFLQGPSPDTFGESPFAMMERTRVRPRGRGRVRNRNRIRGRGRNRKRDRDSFEETLHELFEAPALDDREEEDNNSSSDNDSGHSSETPDEDTEEDSEESHSNILGILSSSSTLPGIPSSSSSSSPKQNKDDSSRRSLSKTESPSSSNENDNNKDSSKRSRTSSRKSISSSTVNSLEEELADLEKQLREQEDKQSRLEETKASSSSSLPDKESERRVSTLRNGVGRKTVTLNQVLNPFGWQSHLPIPYHYSRCCSKINRWHSRFSFGDDGDASSKT